MRTRMLLAQEMRRPSPAGSSPLLSLIPLLIAAGCGADSSLEPTPLAEVCGTQGPFRVLPLAADERPVPDTSIVRVGERIVLIVGTGETPYRTSRGTMPKDTTVRAIGPCGENPVIVGRGINRIMAVPRWPGEVFGCDARTDDLLRLDPDGTAAPELLAESACAATWTAEGLLHITRSDPQRVLLYPYAPSAQPRLGPPVVLLDDIPMPTPIRPLADGVFVLGPDDTLRHVGLDGSVRVEQLGVQAYALSDDERYLLWQAVDIETAADPSPTGDIFVRDRTTSREAFVTHADVRSRNGNPTFPEPDVAQITLGETLAGQWLIDLPTFALYQVPPGRQLLRRVADGRWLARTALFGPYVLRDLETGAETPVADRQGYLFGAVDERLDILATSGHIDFGTMHALLRYSYDGEAPRVLAPRATRGSYVLPDGRLVSPLDTEEGWIGTLAITDPETQEELQIDDRVAVGVELERWHDAFAPDVIAYVVNDGDRSGLWVARPQ